MIEDDTIHDKTSGPSPSTIEDQCISEDDDLSEWKILDLEDMVNTKISVLKAQEMEREYGDYVTSFGVQK